MDFPFAWDLPATTGLKEGRNPQVKRPRQIQNYSFNIILWEPRSEVSEKFGNPLIQLGPNEELTRSPNP